MGVEQNSGPLYPHRTIERSAHPYVEEAPEDLELKGFEFAGNIEQEKSFTPDSSIVDLPTKEIEMNLTERGIAATPPLLKNYTDLKQYILDAMKAGYEVRCLQGTYDNGSLISGEHMTAVFTRFDIDRFMSRIPEEQTEEFFKKSGYKKLNHPMSFHRWGDTMPGVLSKNARDQYNKENKAIVNRIRDLESQGNHVRLKESVLQKKDNKHFLITFYIRRKDSMIDQPYEIHRSLSGETDELPDTLIAHGFTAAEIVQSDDSLKPDPQNIRPPVLLDGQYILAVKNLQDSGLPMLQKPVKGPITLRKRIIEEVRNGYEVRVVRGRFDPLVPGAINDATKK